MSRLSGFEVVTTTHDFTSIADGSHQSIDVTVPGAKLGDFAFCTMDVDNKDCHIQAYVNAADTVEIAGDLIVSTIPELYAEATATS